jgi:predicted dehydrogenase
VEKNKFILIGAGAITESFYLKTFCNFPDLSFVILDSNTTRIQYLREMYPEFEFSDESLESTINKNTFTGGFICLPNYLHAEYIQIFIDYGIPVLVEKPVVTTPNEFNAIVFQGGSLVYVAHLRRFFESSLFLKNLIRDKAFGAVIQVDISDGAIFGWNLQSDYLLNKSKSGGGVLIDSGVHWIDFLIWCLGDLELIAYRDNNEGGVESECVVEFSFSTGAGALRLSRIRNIGQFIRISFEDATLEFHLYASDTINIKLHKSPELEIRHVLNDDVYKAFMLQITTYFSVLSHSGARSQPVVLPEAIEAFKSVDFIHRCYESLT